MFLSSSPKVTYIRNAKLLRIIDADTFEVFIDDGFGRWGKEKIRIFGVDTPEIRGPEKVAGFYVKKKATEWLDISNDDSIVLHSLKFSIDSFARVICEVWRKEKSYNQWLLNEGLAWPTDNKGKGFSRDIERLNLPESVKQSVRESYK